MSETPPAKSYNTSKLQEDLNAVNESALETAQYTANTLREKSERESVIAHIETVLTNLQFINSNFKILGPEPLQEEIVHKGIQAAGRAALSSSGDPDVASIPSRLEGAADACQSAVAKEQELLAHADTLHGQLTACENTLKTMRTIIGDKSRHQRRAFERVISIPPAILGYRHRL